MSNLPSLKKKIALDFDAFMKIEEQDQTKW
jgi:hypothetical protein